MGLNMSEERLDKINSASPAMPNPSSIMSAPSDEKKVQKYLIMVVALVVSIALNIIMGIIFISKNEKIRQLENDLKDDEELIVELKNKINAKSSL